MTTVAAPALTLTIVAVEYVDHDLGHWCRPCGRSTGARVWFTVTIPGCGPEVWSALFCTVCEDYDIEVDP